MSEEFKNTYPRSACWDLVGWQKPRPRIPAGAFVATPADLTHPTHRRWFWSGNDPKSTRVNVLTFDDVLPGQAPFHFCSANTNVWRENLQMLPDLRRSHICQAYTYLPPQNSLVVMTKLERLNQDQQQ